MTERIDHSHARLAAVQALFQMEQAEQGLASVLSDFGEDASGLDSDGEAITGTDGELFRHLVTSVVDRQGEIDRMICAHLASGWRIERIGTTSRAILRTAICEFLTRPGTPLAVIVDEYVWLARSFLDSDETGFINGVLDSAGRRLRPSGPG